MYSKLESPLVDNKYITRLQNLFLQSTKPIFSSSHIITHFSVTGVTSTGGKYIAMNLKNFTICLNW